MILKLGNANIVSPESSIRPTKKILINNNDSNIEHTPENDNSLHNLSTVIDDKDSDNVSDNDSKKKKVNEYIIPRTQNVYL